MSKNNNKKKEDQLGMPFGTANARLRKSLLFHLVKKLKEANCFVCGNEIESLDDFSIEHKIPYLDSEKVIELFFDVENIAFSHLSCNIGSSRKSKKYETEEQRLTAKRNSTRLSARNNYSK